ncbi:MAG: hypothetical protein R3Y19_06390 [Rikenellaceae bacterium]
MKTVITSLVLAIATISTAWSQYTDPMYTSQRSKQEIKQEKEQRKLEKQQQEALEYLSLYELQILKNYPINKDEILVTSAGEAFTRRVDAATATNYDNPEIAKILNQYATTLQQIYPPELYNTIVAGDRIWVEPQYVTAIFSDDIQAMAGVSSYLASAVSTLEVQQLYTTNTFSSYRYIPHNWVMPYGRGLWWGAPIHHARRGYYGWGRPPFMPYAVSYGYPYFGWSSWYCDPWGYDSYLGYGGYYSFWGFSGPYRPVYLPNRVSKNSNVYYGNSQSNTKSSFGPASSASTSNYNKTTSYGQGQKTTTTNKTTTTPSTTVSSPTSTSSGYSGGFTTTSSGTRRR